MIPMALPKISLSRLSPFTPIVSYGDTKSFEPVDKILWCDLSNETSSAVLSRGTISCLSIFTK